MRFKVDWASLIIEGNLPFLLCYALYLRAIFQLQAPGGLIFGGAYFRNFTVIVLSFDHRICLLMNILRKRNDLPFSCKSDRKKDKSGISFTHR